MILPPFLLFICAGYRWKPGPGSCKARALSELHSRPCNWILIPQDLEISAEKKKKRLEVEKIEKNRDRKWEYKLHPFKFWSVE